MTFADGKRKSARRILVADPAPDIRDLYRESIRPIGCDVVDAVDGRDALVRALVDRPSLVITETWLPILDGCELCEMLRRDIQTSTVPILVVTGDARESQKDRARIAGADRVLIKPVTPAALLAEVQRLIDAPPKPDRKTLSATVHLSPAVRRRREKAQLHFHTTTPDLHPPPLVCPLCDRPLRYEVSHVGGVKTQREQWDLYQCPGSCGDFEYRHRTRQTRRV